MILGRDNTKRDAVKPVSRVAVKVAARLASSHFGSTSSGDSQNAHKARLPVDVLIGPSNA